MVMDQTQNQQILRRNRPGTTAKVRKHQQQEVNNALDSNILKVHRILLCVEKNREKLLGLGEKSEIFQFSFVGILSMAR